MTGKTSQHVYILSVENGDLGVCCNEMIVEISRFITRPGGKKGLGRVGLRPFRCALAMMLPCMNTVDGSRSNENQFRLAAKMRAGRTASIDVRESPMLGDSLLSELTDFEALENPNGDGTLVTDRGLASIMELAEVQRSFSLSILKRLSIWLCKVSEDEAKEFQQEEHDLAVNH